MKRLTQPWVTRAKAKQSLRWPKTRPISWINVNVKPTPMSRKNWQVRVTRWCARPAISSVKLTWISTLHSVSTHVEIRKVQLNSSWDWESMVSQLNAFTRWGNSEKLLTYTRKETCLQMHLNAMSDSKTGTDWFNASISIRTSSKQVKEPLISKSTSLLPSIPFTNCMPI